MVYEISYQQLSTLFYYEIEVYQMLIIDSLASVELKLVSFEQLLNNCWSGQNMWQTVNTIACHSAVNNSDEQTDRNGQSSVSSGVFRGGGGCATAPLWHGLCWRR
jgi:hypothetical protein